MSKRTKVFLLILGLFSVLACSFQSPNVSALDLSYMVRYQGSGTNPQWRDDSTSSVSNTWHTGRIIYGGNSGNAAEFNSFYVRGSNGSNLPIENSWFLQLSGRMTFTGTNSKWNTSGNFIYTSNGNCPIVDMETVDVQNHNGSTSNTTQIYNYTITCKYTGSNNGVPQVGFKVQSMSQLDTFQFSVQNWFLWSSGSTTYDDTDVINAINNVRTSINNVYNAVGTTNNKLDDTNDKLDDLNEIANTLKNSQEQANQDANDRYQDEKDTINDNAQQGQEQSESLGGINLSILNPLNAWKNYFTNGCSVNIPIIAGWIHSPSSTYTSWWCTNSTLSGVKSVLTGVISIVGVMIVFGFAFKWLRTNNGED